MLILKSFRIIFIFKIKLYESYSDMIGSKTT
jgi:hypothetical protein